MKMSGCGQLLVGVATFRAGPRLKADPGIDVMTGGMLRSGPSHRPRPAGLAHLTRRPVRQRSNSPLKVGNALFRSLHPLGDRLQCSPQRYLVEDFQYV